MALKGTTKIELTNVKTGEKEVIEKDNLVTNVLNDLVTRNPFLQNMEDTEVSYMNINDSFPICPNLVGGILLYEDAIEENADNYYAASTNNLVGYSSNTVNSGTDERRGSLNQTESGVLETNDGYRFVFDFTTSQANGTISSVGLTSKWGGVEGYGSARQVGLYRLKSGISYSPPDINAYYRSLFNSISMIDGDNNVGYAAMLTADNLISVAKYRLNINTIGLVGNNAIPGVIEESVIETETFGKYSVSNYITFVNDGKGFIWGLQFANGAEYVQSGDAVINWVKINPIDWSFTEGTWTFNLPLYRLGYQHKITTTDSYRLNFVIIHEDFLYVSSYDNYSVYKINLNNITDITQIMFDDKSLMITGLYSYRSQYSWFNLIGNVVIFPGGYIIGDTAYKAAASTSNDSSYGLAACSSPALKWGPYLFTINKSTYISANATINARLMTPYLATINNLATPVQKTADKTMKITYILREETA